MHEIGVPPSLVDAVTSIRDAVKAGRTDIFYKLIEACDSLDGGGTEDRKQLLNAQCTDDGTFLHTATKLGHRDIVRALLDSGADPGILDGDGNSPIQVSPSESVTAVFIEELLRATSHSEVGRVCQLLASGLCVNAEDNPLSRNSPLHWAASFGDADTVSCLVARGALVNKRNGYGATPLHDAVARGSTEIVEVLVSKGAKPHIECRKGPYRGKNAFGIVKNNDAILECLKSYSEDSDSCHNYDPLCNGSPPSALIRQSRLGSMESLRSIGVDSVMTNGLDDSSLLIKTAHTNKLFRAKSLKSVDEESSLDHHRTNETSYRSPLQSSSSLEMNPLIEQVCERLSAIQLKTPPRALVTVPALHELWPQPKRITELSLPPWIVPDLLTLSISRSSLPLHQIVDVWNIHKEQFKEIGVELKLEGVLSPTSAGEKSAVSCIVDPKIHATPSGYKINVNPNGAIISCGSLPALHHSIVTLLQILRVFKDADVDNTNGEILAKESDQVKITIPSLAIVDSPSLPYRGFMLDMSPTTRVPTVDQLGRIIDCLSAMKMNQLHLIFRISNNSTEGNSRNPKNPLTISTSDILLLERYCLDRSIDLIPGFDLESPCNVSLEFVLQIIFECLSSFTSNRYLHIGPSLTSFFVEANAHSPVWNNPSLQNDRILMICANVFHANKKAMDSLPISAIIIEYGFQADYDFSNGCKISVDSGRPLAISPGTAAWTSLAGWPEAGVTNVYSGVVSGLQSGAVGVVVAHWGHYASLTPFCFSFPPLVVAAGLSWNHNTHWDFVHGSVGSLIDRHLVLVADCGVGDAIIELGRCETWLTRVARDQAPADCHNLPSTNPGSVLHQLLCDPDAVIVDSLTSEAFSSVIRHVRKAVREKNSLKSSSVMKAGGLGQVASVSKWASTPNVLMELNLSMDMIITACKLGRALVTTGTNPRSNMGIAVVNPGVANLPPTFRTDLANKILALKEVYSSLWLQSNQSQGLQTSLLVFTSLLSKLLLKHNYDTL